MRAATRRQHIVAPLPRACSNRPEYGQAVQGKRPGAGLYSGFSWSCKKIPETLRLSSLLLEPRISSVAHYGVK
jgi:hypothetical protein